MALVCQKVVSQLRNTHRNGALAAKLGVFTLWDFATVLQLRNEGHYAAKWHSCAKIWFRNCKTPCGMELWLRNWEFFMFWSFAAVSQLRNEGSCAAKWHSCAKLGFAAAKIFAKESIELRNDIAKDGCFRRDTLITQRLLLGCETISQRSANFAENSLRLRNLADPCFCPVFAPFLLRKTSFQFLCNSSCF